MRPEGLRARIHAVEHRLLPAVVENVARGALDLDASPGRTHVTDKRALISVSDKTGLLAFANGLVELGVELIATSGTGGLPERAEPRLDARGGPDRRRGDARRARQDAAPVRPRRLLARRDDEGDQASLAEHGIQPIDLVVVNLYPFQRVAARRESSESRARRVDRHRRPGDAARGGQELRRRRGRRRSRALRLRARRAARVRRRAQPRHAPRARGRGVRAHRRLRHRDRELVLRRRVVPRAPVQRAGQGHRPRLRREPAPARRLLRRARGAPPRALDGAPARRPAALVQQHRRPRRRDDAGARVHACRPA